MEKHNQETAPLDLSDIRAVMNAALRRVITIPFESEKLAKRYRFRAYGLRSREIGASRIWSEPSDPEYGTSPWDRLVFSIMPPDAGEPWALWIMIPTTSDLGIVT